MSDNSVLCESLNFELPSRSKRGRQKTPKFIAVDFFCGAGGTTRGLIDAGGYVVAGIDKVTTCAQTYLCNNGNNTWNRDYPEFLAMDIFPKSEDFPEGQQEEIASSLDVLIENAKNIYPNTPVCFAICAPCQPFTRLSHDLTDTRSDKRKSDRNLLMHACHFIKRYNPEYVLSENVAGIASQKFGGVWQEFKAELERLGYVTGSDLVCASNYGVPQRRKRSILVGVRNDLFDVVPDKLELPISDPSAQRINVGKMLAGLPKIEAGSMHPTVPNHLTRGLNDLNYRRISYAPAGGSNAYLENTPEGDLSLPCHKRVNKKFSQRCFGDSYTRMNPKEISPTITTKCHSFTNGRFGHPDITQNRCISMREAARLQSFEDDYVFYPKNQLTSVATQIGNAVPPKLASFFMNYLLNSASDTTLVKRSGTQV